MVVASVFAAEGCNPSELVKQMCTVLHFNVSPHQPQQPAPFPLGQQLAQDVQLILTSHQEAMQHCMGSHPHCKARAGQHLGDDLLLT